MTVAAVVLAIGMLVQSLVVARGFSAIHRGFTRCSDALEKLHAVELERARGDPAGTPELASRLEAVERRVELALDDLNRQYRKLRQARRDAGDPDPEDEPDPHQLELLRAQLASSSGGGAPTGRLVRRK